MSIFGLKISKLSSLFLLLMRWTLSLWCFVCMSDWRIPNEHSTSIQRRFDVDIITSIRRITNLEKFPLHFHVLFRCNFAGRIIHVVSTYFLGVTSLVEKPMLLPRTFSLCNFNGQKIHVVSKYFFRCNFCSRNIHGVSTYFFRRNFDGQNFDVIFGKLVLVSLVANYYEVTFVTSVINHYYE